MMLKESIWLGENLTNLVNNKNLTSLLNVGSSTGNFRETEQPHINKNVFLPLTKHINVDHLDIKENEGVDIVGDLTDRDFLKSLKDKQYDILLCSNLLEHVPNPSEICESMEACVRPGGYLVITVPNLYPYHNDPIDTMFRPDVYEVLKMFSFSTLIKGEIISMGKSHFDSLMRNKKLFLLTIARWFTPFYKFQAWKKIISDIPNTFSDYKVTCVILRKN